MYHKEEHGFEATPCVKISRPFLQRKGHFILQPSVDRQFIIHTKRQLGAGGFGKVYFAEERNCATNKITQSCAAKICPKEEFQLSEFKYLARFVECQLFIYTDDDNSEKICLIQEFFTEGKLIDKDGTLHPKIKALTLPDRLRLILELIKDCFLMHYSPTSEAITHGDLHGGNVLVNHTSKANTSLKLVPIDFGLAKPVTQKNIFDQDNSPIDGQSFYHPPEFIDGEFHTASDIFMLTPLIASLLGANNPLQSKINFVNKQKNIFYPTLKKIATLPLDYSGIELRDGIFGLPLRTRCIHFLNKMSDPIYGNRPNIAQVQDFFTSLSIIILQDKLVNQYRSFDLAKVQAKVHKNSNTMKNLLLDSNDYLVSNTPTLESSQRSVSQKLIIAASRA